MVAELHRRAAEEPGGAAGDRDVGAAGQFEDVAGEGGAAAGGVGADSDAGELDVRVAEEHGEGAEVIGVAAEVGIEVDADAISSRVYVPGATSSSP